MSGEEHSAPETADVSPFRAAGSQAKGLDPLIRYMSFHWVLGALGGALATTALLFFDPFGFWPLIHDSGLGLPAIFLLYVGFMTSCGGLVCAAAVMFPPNDDDPRGGLRGKATPPQLALARVAARRA
jgi:hypothetical protein